MDLLPATVSPSQIAQLPHTFLLLRGAVQCSKVGMSVVVTALSGMLCGVQVWGQVL